MTEVELVYEFIQMVSSREHITVQLKLVKKGQDKFYRIRSFEASGPARLMIYAFSVHGQSAPVVLSRQPTGFFQPLTTQKSYAVATI